MKTGKLCISDDGQTHKKTFFGKFLRLLLPSRYGRDCMFDDVSNAISNAISTVVIVQVKNFASLS